MCLLCTLLVYCTLAWLVDIEWVRYLLFYLFQFFFFGLYYKLVHKDTYYGSPHFYEISRSHTFNVLFGLNCSSSHIYLFLLLFTFLHVRLNVWICLCIMYMDMVYANDVFSTMSACVFVYVYVAET